MCERENAADVLADLQAWVGEPFDAAGRRYDGGKESVDFADRMGDEYTSLYEKGEIITGLSVKARVIKC